MEVSRLRFLVVEDHGFQRWAMGNLLQGMGAQFVFPAADGEEALALLRESDHPVDIVVSDLDMPGMDGMELIRHLVAAGCGASLIIVTSLDRSLVGGVENMARAYGARLLGALQKPVNARQLQALIAQHHAGARASGAAPRAFDPGEALGGLRRGEFEAFFQPKVDLATRALRGAEALARWRHPREGVVLPVRFLHLLEDEGAIGELTERIVRHAAAACRAWQEAGIEIPVSVNLSPGNLDDLTLADRMSAVAADAGLDPWGVMFEVTESAAARDLGPTLENLARLRMRGFGLSIDDYGTGYSSMQRLARVPFTELKIDRGFVQDVPGTSAGRAAVESSLEIARKLGIVAVAEGVESHAEWQALRGLGCQLAQGFLFAPPMEAGAFLAWARSAAR